MSKKFKNYMMTFVLIACTFFVGGRFVSADASKISYYFQDENGNKVLLATKDISGTYVGTDGIQALIDSAGMNKVSAQTIFDAKTAAGYVLSGWKVTNGKTKRWEAYNKDNMTSNDSIETDKGNLTATANWTHKYSIVTLNGNKLASKDLTRDVLVDETKAGTVKIATTDKDYPVEIGKDSLVLTFALNEGYRVKSFKVGETELKGNISRNSYTINRVNDDLTITVEYEKIPYTVTVNADAGVTLNPENGKVNTTWGSNETIGVTLKEGYILKSIVVAGHRTNLVKMSANYGKFDATKGELTLYNIKANQTVTIVTERMYFDVTTKVSGGHGTITESKSVEYGEDFEVVLTPETGYGIERLIVDEVEVEVTGDTYKFTKVTAKHSVEVVYGKLSFILQVKSADNVELDPSEPVKVFYGDKKEIKIVAALGFEIAQILVNDEEVEFTIVDDVYLLENITDNTTVKVVVKAIEYELTEGEEQTFEQKGDLTFEFDGPLSLVVKGYVDGKELTEADATFEEGSTIVNLLEAFLAKLEDGEHTLTVEYANGTTAEATFTVSGHVVENPKTADAILLYVSIAAISLVGMVGCGLYLNKKRYN